MGVIIRQSFKASISNYAGILLGFLSLFILFPKFFSPEELGAVRLFLELGAVMSAFALLGTNYSINRFFPYFKTEDQKHNGFFFWVLVFPIIGFCFLMILMAFWGKTIFLFLNENALNYRELFPILIVLIFINVFLTVSETTSANHGRTAVPNFSREFLLRVFIIISATLYFYKIISFTTCMWLMVGSYGIALIINIVFLYQLTKISLKPNFNFLKENPQLKTEILKFTAVLMFSSLSALVIPKIDFFLISKIQKDLSQVAIYSIGFYLATFIEIPRRTITQISLPIISSHLKNNNLEELNKLNKKNGTNQLIVASLLFLLIWLNIDNLYEIMPKGEIYKKGKMVVFIIGMAKVIESVNSFYSPIVANSKLYKWAPILIIFNAITSISFNYFFIIKYGLIGGAISASVCIVLINLFGGILVKKLLDIHPFEKKQINLYIIFGMFLTFSFCGKLISNPFIDSIFKTLVFGISYIFLILKLKVSDDFTNLVFTKFPFLRFFLKIKKN